MTITKSEEIPSYHEEYSVEWQIDSEELIAAIIFDNTTAGEELSNQLGQEILKKILWNYRKDLFEDPQEPAETDNSCSACLGTGIGQSGPPDTSRCGSCRGTGLFKQDLEDDRDVDWDYF
jgi:hypothetical protein